MLTQVLFSGLSDLSGLFLSFFRRVLIFISLAKEDIRKNELVIEMMTALKHAQGPLQGAISNAHLSETALFDLIQLNDEILKIQTTYANLLKGIRPPITTLSTNSSNVDPPQQSKATTKKKNNKKRNQTQQL